MEQIVEIKNKKQVTVLLIISLIMQVLRTSIFLVDYSRGNTISSIIFSTSLLTLFLLCSRVLSLSSVILFAMYILKLYKKRMAVICLPIILGFIVFTYVNFFDWIINVSFLGPIGTRKYLINSNVLYILLCALFIIILATVGVLKGTPSVRIIMCIVAGCGFFWVGKSIFNCVILVYHRWFFESMFSLLFLTEFVGSICLYAALLFFGLKNKIPAIIKVSPEKLKSKIEKKPPAVALNELKKKLDNKEISTEEYESWRADILNKL